MHDLETKALIDFMKKSIGAVPLIARTTEVIQKLDRNSRYPGVDSVLDPLKRKFTEFTTAWGAAQGGTTEQKLVAKRLKGELQQALKAVCEFCNEATPGNREALSTTGFNLSKETPVKVVLGPVEDFVVKNTTVAGDVFLSFKKEHGTTGTNFEYTYDENPSDESNWVSYVTGKSQCTIKGLTPGWKVSFRVTISGPRNQVVRSEIITKTISFGQ